MEACFAAYDADGYSKHFLYLMTRLLLGTSQLTSRSLQQFATLCSKALRTSLTSIMLTIDTALQSLLVELIFNK